MPNSLAGRPLRPILRTFLFAITCAGATGVHADENTATRWFAHVEALANDGMEGRNFGEALRDRPVTGGKLLEILPRWRSADWETHAAESAR